MLTISNTLFLSLILYFSFFYYSKLTIKAENKCKVNNLKKSINNIVWKRGNYIDLGANSGNSVIWFYNIRMPDLKYTVLYPRILVNITNNFNTYIFEANPFLCNKIYSVVEYIKRKTKLINFNVYCPVIVSTYDGTDIFTIDNNDVASSKYYNTNTKYNTNRKNFTLPVINITRFLSENIQFNDFNVMKFDVLYSEFHNMYLNNPVSKKASNIFKNFLNYTKENGIETYEELKVTKQQRENHMSIYNDLRLCRNYFFK